MLQTIDTLRGCMLVGIDGDFGKVDDFYFNDDDWAVRYLIADTGTWLTGRLILIAPQSLGKFDADGEQLPVELTQKQVEESPPVQHAQPVSRQHERDLHGHFGWVPYWGHEMPPVDMPASRKTKLEEEAAATVDQATGAATHQAGDPHLRSAREVIGYAIHARDGELGHVEDLLVNTREWRIERIIVDTRNWLPGRKVVVPAGAAPEISWTNRAVQLDLTREQLEDSPELAAVTSGSS